MEIWKDIEGFEGRYQVSDLGNVKSLGNDKDRKEKILKACVDGRGYLLVDLHKEGKRKTIRVHSLVANAFIPKVESHNKMCVDHIDNDKLNNRLENLQRITNRKNLSKDSKSELPVGVRLSVNKTKSYKTKIGYNSKSFYIGCYNTITKASNAYEINRQRIEYKNLPPIKIKLNNLINI